MEEMMKQWLLNRFKNKYIRIGLIFFGLGIIALCAGASVSAVVSVWLIGAWYIYIDVAIGRSSILSAKEKRIVRFCVLFLSLLALSTIRSFKEILTLLVLMAVRSDIAIWAWFRAGKGYWLTAIASAALNVIGLIVIYTTVDLLKTHLVDKHGHKIISLPFIISNCLNNYPGIKKIIDKFVKKIVQERNIQKFFLEIQAIANEIRRIGIWIKHLGKLYREKLAHLINNKEFWFLLLIFGIPLPIPYLPTIVIIRVRYKNMRYGLWWLMIVNFIKIMIFVWLVWRGWVLIT